ncbi:MAG: ABC transporter permease [Planctomycetes bacterium]|nr:ABC transporter permease [Planctomycetota bacterium]
MTDAPPSRENKPLGRAPARMQELGLVVVVILLGTFLAFASRTAVRPDGSRFNTFLQSQNLIGNVATNMSWIAIMAVGVTCVIIAGGIDISVGSIFALSALGTVAALQNMPADASAWMVLPVAVVVPLAIGSVCGLINGVIVVGLRMHPFIVTLGTLSIFRGIALIAVPTKQLPVIGRSMPPAFTDRFVTWTVTLGQGVTLQPTPMIVMLLCVAAGWIYLGHTVGGRQLYAVGGNEEAARFSGLPVGWIKVRVYVLSGLAAGVAGMISAGYFGSATTATGDGYELIVIASAVVGGVSLSGGRGTALGAMLGALIIKLIENGIILIQVVNLRLFSFRLSMEYSKIVIGIAIIVAVAVDRLSDYLRRRRLAGRVFRR